jgi:hypothetical protein
MGKNNYNFFNGGAKITFSEYFRETFSVDRYMSRCKTELDVKYKIKNSSVNSGH